MTLNDKRYLLCSIAKKYANRPPHYYQIDELINEAWLNKNVQQQEEAGRICIAGEWAMKTYMKMQEKKCRKKWHIQFHQLELDETHDHPESFDKDMYEIRELAYKLLYMTKLNSQQRQALKMRFYDGLTYEFISRTLGLTRERVRQIIAEALRSMRYKYKRICA